MSLTLCYGSFTLEVRTWQGFTHTLDQVREAYGVVLDEQTLQLDEEEAARLRGAAG